MIRDDTTSIHLVFDGQCVVEKKQKKSSLESLRTRFEWTVEFLEAMKYVIP